jgi:hypothetical protein
VKIEEQYDYHVGNGKDELKEAAKVAKGCATRTKLLRK